ncbi:MAG: NAD(+)/NADH kinase [Muribaculaceae bacterium]|nr:NAD(+)/NADH kinase [Muribaculaceae bacterium]
MIAVFGNPCQESHIAELREFLAMLASEGIETVIHQEFGEWLLEFGVNLYSARPVETLPERVDLLVSIGGDGTFLRSAEWLGGMPVAVLGINTGHLGYLAGFTFAKPQEVREAIVAGRFDKSERMMLEVESDYLPSGISRYALNEVSVLKGDTSSMVDVIATLGDDFLADYRGDGLLISTPTGSTAYNLSCGGPILEPELHNLIITPVAPHSLSIRPLVVGSDAPINLSMNSRGRHCNVAIDGRTFAVPANGGSLTVRQAPFVLTVAMPPGKNFARVLREKLNWNE